MPRPVLIAPLVVMLACTRAPASSGNPAPGPDNARPDSIVLERTRCFGTCPAYRLRINAGGHVAFESRTPGERGRVAADSLGPIVIDSLVTLAEAIGLFALPETIDRGSPQCPSYATDHPTIRLGVFGIWQKRFDYYTGCHDRSESHLMSDPMRKLMAFAATIDTLTRADRWIRPARGR